MPRNSIDWAMLEEFIQTLSSGLKWAEIEHLNELIYSDLFELERKATVVKNRHLLKMLGLNTDLLAHSTHDCAKQKTKPRLKPRQNLHATDQLARSLLRFAANSLNTLQPQDLSNTQLFPGSSEPLYSPSAAEAKSMPKSNNADTFSKVHQSILPHLTIAPLTTNTSKHYLQDAARSMPQQSISCLSGPIENVHLMPPDFGRDMLQDKAELEAITYQMPLLECEHNQDYKCNYDYGHGHETIASVSQLDVIVDLAWPDFIQEHFSQLMQEVLLIADAAVWQ